MRVTNDWYVRYLQREKERRVKALGPAPSPTLPHPPHPGSIPQCSVQAGTLGEELPEEEDSGRGVPRYRVEITSYRVRLVDTDNLCPKWHIDALRHCGLIPDDTPDLLEVSVRQIKVGRKSHERTIIRLYDRG